MAVPYLFSNVAGGSSLPLAWLDDNFAYLATSPTLTNLTLNGNLTVLGNSNFANTATFNNLIINGSLSISGGGFTGTGLFVLNNQPTLINPTLGIPASGTLTNCTGLPLSTGVTGVLPVTSGGTGLTSLGTGVATWLGTPSSANLRAALTDETGTGSAVFANSPTLTNPQVLGSSTGYTSFVSANASTTNYSLTLPAINGTLITSGDVGTVTQTMMANNVPGTGLFFGAYLASSILGRPSNSSTKLTFQVNFGTGWNDAGSRMISTATGYYQVNCTAQLAGANLTAVALYVYKNGSLFKELFFMDGISSSKVTISGSCIVTMFNLTDYIEFYVVATTSAGLYNVNAGANNSYASGFLMRKL